MKNYFTRSLVLLLLSLCSLWSVAQTNVIGEDFTSEQLPTGWTESGTYWSFENSEAVYSQVLENGSDTLFSPLVSVATLREGQKPYMRIDYRLLSSNSRINQLSVLYRNSLSEAWNELSILSESATTTTQYLELPFNASATRNVQVAIVAVYKGGGTTAVGYISVENRREVPVAPDNFRFESLTSNSVSLIWANCSSDYFLQNNLKVSTTPITDFSQKADTYDDNVVRAYIDLANLSPNQTYYAYVRYECEDGETSPWAELQFTTPCVAVQVPYTETFEDGLSACYTIVNHSRRALVNTAYPHNSTKAFQFINTVNTKSYLFLPELDVTKIQDYQISFYVASEVSSSSYSRELTIGVADEATESSFTELKTITLPQGQKWEYVTISLIGYKGTGKIIAFRSGNATAENHIVIDDITIKAAQDCPQPMFTTVQNVTYNSARISWLEAGNASEWNLVVATRQYTDPAECEPNMAKGEFAGSVVANPYQLSNLTPQTTYYVYVQSACAEGEWTDVVSFTTGKAVTIPYSEGFDRLDPDFYTDNYMAVPEQWVMGTRVIDKDHKYYDREDDAANASYISTTLDHTASAYTPAALVLRGTTSAAYYTSYAMMPAMPVDVNQLFLSFWAYSNNGSSVRIIVGVADVQSNEIEQGKQLALGGNVTPIDTLSFKAEKTWENFNISLTPYTGKGRYITFYLEPGIATPGVYIDDIAIDYAPTCFAVRNLSAEATSTATFKTSWTETMNATSWNIKVSSTEIDPATTDGDIVKNAVVNTIPEYEATGLTPNTTYYVYVSPACDDLWASTTVTTLYALTVPYYNDFSTEPTGGGKAPQYWTNGNLGTTVAASSTYRPYVYTTAWSARDTKGYPIPAEVLKPSLRFYAAAKSTKATATQPYIIMPELSNADVHDVALSFWAWSSAETRSSKKDPLTNEYIYSTTGYDYELKIGVITDPTDISTLTEVTSVTVIGDTVKQPLYFCVDMSSYTGDGKYIVFYMNNSTNKLSDICIDNLVINLSSTPQRVTNVQVIDSTITEISAKLKWHENGDAKSWNIRLFTAEQTDPSAETPVKEFTANDTIFDLTGLSHSTQYYVYVQSIKGAEVGMWSPVRTFWTKPGIWTVPFYEDFNSYATGNGTLPPYYEVSGTALPTVKSSSTPAVYHESKSNVIYFTTSSNKSGQLLFPKFDKPINTLQMTMDACGYSSDFGEQSTTYFGVVTSDGQFHEVAKMQTTAAKKWEEWLVDFSSYTGEDGRIAILQDYARAGATKTLYICLEDIKIVETPQCKRVASVDVSAITSSTASIQWNKADVETAWNLKVASKPLASPSDSTADTFDGQVTATSKALENLLPGTTYYVYVQSVRDDKDCVGEWSIEKAFTTLCLPVALPYTEDYEGYQSEMIPDCYTLSGKITNKTAASVGSLSWYNGGKALRLAQVDVAYKNYCAFPLVDCKDASELQLSMLVMPSASGTVGTAIEECSKYFYEVGVMTDPNDITTYVSMFADSVVADGTKTGKDKYYSFANYAGDDNGNRGKYIAIQVLPYKGSTGKEYSGSIYIDQVTVERIVSCTPPTELIVVAKDNDSVSLSWKATSNKGTFRIRIFDKADVNPNIDTPVKDILVKDTTFAGINGLNGNTVYYAYVRRECSETDHSTWSRFATWHTDCDDIQLLPYIETFEGCTSNQVPNCWSQITDTYTTNDRGQCSGSSTVKISVAGSDNQYLYVTYGDAGCSKKGAAKAITPMLSVTSLREVVLYFDAKNNGYNKTADLLIEAVESPLEDAPAIPIVTIKGVNADQWQTYYFDLADYYESAQPYQYLRFTPTGASVLLDNIHIITDRTEVIPVQLLTLAALRDTTATITFVEATPFVHQWVVEYGPKGFAIGSGTQLVADTTAVTLTGLTPNTLYDVYVRANVDKATYSDVLTFTTTLPAATLPYNYGFDDAVENANNWKFINVNASGKEHINQWAFVDASLVGAEGTTALSIQHEGNVGYYITGNSSDHCYDYAVRYINIPAIGTYTVGIRARNKGNLDPARSTQDFIAVSLAPSMVTPVGQSLKRMDNTTGSPTVTKKDYNEYNVIPKFYGEPAYKELIDTVTISQPGVYQLLCYWQNYSFGIAGEAPAIDSIWVEEYECTEPSNHAITMLTDTSAAFSWFAGGNDKFEVVVSRYAKSPRPDELDAADVVAHKTFVGGPSFTISGLQPSTTYSFYQRTICSTGPTEWHEMSFTTNCVNSTLPLYEPFAEDPMCWTLSAGVHASVAKYLTDEMDDAGEEAEEWNCLYMPIGSYVILPDFGVEASRLAIQMNVFNGLYLTKYEIGVVDSSNSIESFQSIQTIQTKNRLNMSSSAGNPYQLEEFTVLLHRYRGTGHHIAIKADPAYVCNIKDITVTLLPECVAPQLVEVTQITENSALVHWIPGNEEEWEIAVGTDTFKVYEQPFDIINHAPLTQGTTYSLSVRAHCDDTHASAWTVPISFTTVCGTNDLPLVQSFEGMPIADDYSDIMINCWQQMTSEITLDSMLNLADASRYFTPITAQQRHSWDAKRWSFLPTANIDFRFGGRAHLASPFATKSTSDKFSKWLFLPIYAIEDHTTMSFNLAFSCNDGKSRYKGNTDAPYFCIVATTDNGKTFTKVQSIDLSKYDSIFTPVQIDLSQFAGQNVKLGFYHTTKYSYYYFNFPSIRIDNIRINCTQQHTIADEVCQDYNYTANGFIIPKDSLAGPNESKTFSRFATNAGVECDSLISLTLTTLPTQTTEFSATLCQGDVYTIGSYQFTEPNPDGTPYRLLLTSAAGCDSIVMLSISMQQPQALTQDTALCAAQLPFEWNNITISKQGSYPYIVNHGSCEDTITLRVAVLHADTIAKDTVLLTTDLPFVFMGQEVLAKGAEAGLYDREISVAGDPCATVYRWHIDLKMPEGWSNVEAGALAIYPTLIEVGQSVNLTLPASIGNDVKVEVCDMLGKCLATYSPTTSHIVLSEFHTQGIYIIRVTSDDVVYGVGRIITK